MLAATLLTFIAAAAPPAPDYRQAELTDFDRHNIAIVCTTSRWSKGARLACLKAETEKLLQQKQAEVDARNAEARTARQTAR